jgi:hypothetical protein
LFGNADGCFWREAMLNNNTLAKQWGLVSKILGIIYKEILYSSYMSKT